MNVYKKGLSIFLIIALFFVNISSGVVYAHNGDEELLIEEQEATVNNVETQEEENPDAVNGDTEEQNKEDSEEENTEEENTEEENTEEENPDAVNGDTEEQNEEQNEEDSEEEPVVRNYEIVVSSIDSLCEVGENIEILPELLCTYVQDGEQQQEIIDNERISFDIQYDMDGFELVDTGKEESFTLKRKSAKKYEIVLTALFEDENGEEIFVENRIKIKALNYKVSFTNLRGTKKTWVYTDESDYKLILDTTKLENKEKAEVVWSVVEKESQKQVEKGYKPISANTIRLNGITLNKNGFAGKVIIVEAAVYSEGIYTGYSCKTEVNVKKPQVSLYKDIEGKYLIGKNFNYGKTVKAYVENSLYPEESVVSLNISKIQSSNTGVLKVSYNDSNKKWTLKSLKTGTANVTFRLNLNDKEYVIKRKITIYCNHETTYADIQCKKILDQAIGWLGCKESDGSHKKIIDTYNSYSPLPLNYKVTYTDAWCATYVSAIAIKQEYTHLIPVECGCGRMIELLKDIGCWRENENCTPKSGWLIFYDWNDSGSGDNKGWPEHVGIVEKVVNGKITVLEGNYNDKVGRRIINVNGKYIRGYGIPDYGREITKATTGKNGVILEGCAVCQDVNKTIIYAASQISLAKTNFTYSGKQIKPTVFVKNSKGKTISGKEYEISGATERKSVGKYVVTVTLDGEKYKGTKKLYYTINPGAPSKVNAFLYGGHDDVKITWNKRTEADGYNVYYKKSSDSEYKKLTSTTKDYCKIKNLADGKKYMFKVVPYFIWNGKKVESCNSKTDSLYTLKKLKNMSVSTGTTSVKVKWEKISGATGYQVSKSLRSGETIIVANTKNTSVSFKKYEGSRYYYKVRAYKTVDGKKIYGPWSEVLRSDK